MKARRRRFGPMHDRRRRNMPKGSKMGSPRRGRRLAGRTKTPRPDAPRRRNHDTRYRRGAPMGNSIAQSGATRLAYSPTAMSRSPFRVKPPPSKTPKPTGRSPPGRRDTGRRRRRSTRPSSAVAKSKAADRGPRALIRVPDICWTTAERRLSITGFGARGAAARGPVWCRKRWDTGCLPCGTLRSGKLYLPP